MFEYTNKKAYNKSINKVVQRLPLADTIYYGVGPARHSYIHESGKNRENPDTHQTVDTLNEAIGFENGYKKAEQFIPGVTTANFHDFQRLPLGRKRSVVDAVLDQDQTPYHQDEKEWINWLKQPSRRNALLMNDINANDCRRDKKITVGSIAETKQSPANRHVSAKLNDSNGVLNTDFWKEEDYNVNIPKPKSKSYDIAKNQRDLHNQLVDGDVVVSKKAEDKLSQGNYGFIPKTKHKIKMGGEIIDKTVSWLRNVNTRFWRFTSLMGLDFFKHKNKRVEFVRSSVNTDGILKPRSAYEAQSITDSEWKHVKNMRYDTSGDPTVEPFVKRVDPV